MNIARALKQSKHSSLENNTEIIICSYRTNPAAVMNARLSLGGISELMIIGVKGTDYAIRARKCDLYFL